MNETDFLDECGRCGSSMIGVPCESCPPCGYYDEPDAHCPDCEGTGWVTLCISTREWCKANPLAGRERAARHSRRSAPQEQTP